MDRERTASAEECIRERRIVCHDFCHDALEQEKGLSAMIFAFVEHVKRVRGPAVPLSYLRDSPMPLMLHQVPESAALRWSTFMLHTVWPNRSAGEYFSVFGFPFMERVG